MSLTAELPKVAGRHRNRALAKARAVRAVELAAGGKTYAAIADALGYADRGTVHRIVRKELDARGADGVDMLRAVEVARLDALQCSLWEKAMAGDAAAALTVLRIIGQRARLLGLVGASEAGARQAESNADLTGRTVVLLPHERSGAGITEPS